MPRVKRPDLLEELKQLDEKKKQLIKKREEELAKIISKTGYYSIDNDLLLGAILYIKELTDNNDNDNNKDSVLETFKNKAKTFKGKKKK